MTFLALYISIPQSTRRLYINIELAARYLSYPALPWPPSADAFTLA